MPLPDVGPHDVQTAVSAHQHVLLGRAQRLARPSVGRQRAARHCAREGQGRRACNHSHNTNSATDILPLLSSLHGVVISCLQCNQQAARTIHIMHHPD